VEDKYVKLKIKPFKKKTQKREFNKKIYLILGAIIMTSLISFSLMDYYSDEDYIQKLLPKFLFPIKEFVSFNLNDNRSIGYEYLNSSGDIVDESDADVIHTWNTEHDYYFDKSSGIQFTNNFKDYWTRNVFCGGYENDQGEWVYVCNDELPFNWSIETDNLTYVNYTGFKEVSLGENKLRVAVRYHLKTNDESLTIQFNIKNIGENDIDNNDLGFAWKVFDINISGQEDDSITVNGTKYLLNQQLDNTYTKLNQTIYFLSDVSGLNLWLSWDEKLDYFLKVKSEENQFNAPVTLGVAPLLVP